MTRTRGENAADPMHEEAVDRVLLLALRAIPRDHDSVYGICDWLNTYCLSQNLSFDWLEEISGRFEELTAEWPEFSGNKTYPVPYPYDERMPAAVAYQDFSHDHMWDRDHPYGAARWRLVEWMIRNLEETR